MLQVRFPIDQIIKAQFPDPTFTDRALVGAKPEPGRFFILPLSSSVTESQRSDPSDWHVGIIPFRAPSLSPEMLSCALDATLGGSLSLSAVTGPNQESAKSGPGRWGGYKFPFNEDFDGFDDDLNYFVKLTKPRWLCWAGAGIM